MKNQRVPLSWRFLRLLLCLLLTTGCAPTVAPAPAGAEARVEITVMAAASLSGSFEALARLYETQHPNARVTINFAGSQQLAQQLSQGAKADIFASANLQNMQSMMENGRVNDDAPRVFARNRLVVVTPKGNPAGVSAFTELNRPGLKIVLAAAEVPVGRYTLEALDSASSSPETRDTFREGVLANVVSYEDNVRAVLTKVSLGEADAGIVYMTDAASTRDKVEQIEIPEKWNVTAQYPLAVIADSANPDLAQAFVETVLSPEGQAILKSFGFLPASDE